MHTINLHTDTHTHTHFKLYNFDKFLKLLLPFIIYSSSSYSKQFAFHFISTFQSLVLCLLTRSSGISFFFYILTNKFHALKLFRKPYIKSSLTGSSPECSAIFGRLFSCLIALNTSKLHLMFNFSKFEYMLSPKHLEQSRSTISGLQNSRYPIDVRKDTQNS